MGKQVLAQIDPLIKSSKAQKLLFQKVRTG